MMTDEQLKTFEKMADCHKDILIEAALKDNYLIWINMCNIYGFRGEEDSLRQYIRSQASANRK